MSASFTSTSPHIFQKICLENLFVNVVDKSFVLLYNEFKEKLFVTITILQKLFLVRYMFLTAKEVNMTFGTKLKKLREENNMSQVDVAAALHTSDRTVGNWERGLSYPNLEYAAKLAKLFDVSMDYLVSEDEGFMMEAQEQYGSRGREQAEKLIEDVRGLFYGGELMDEDRDSVFRIMSEIYFDAKEKNKKYKPKKYR